MERKLPKLLCLKIAVVIILLSSGCKDDSFMFPLELNLSATEIKSSHLIGQIRNLFIIDTFLIIIDNKPPNGKYIQILSINDYGYLGSSGIIGKGPGEIVNIASPALDAKNRIIWCPDWGTNKILRFPLDSILSNPEFLPTFYVPIRPGLMPLRNLTTYNNELFAYLDYRYLVSFLDLEGKTVDSLGVKNELPSEIWENATLYDLPYVFRFHPGKDKIVMMCRFQNFLAITDLTGKILSSVKGPDIPERVIKSDLDRIKTYYSLSISEKYIYFLYSGKARGSWNSEEMKPLPQYPNTIHVYNWEGKAISRLNLDHPIITFEVDENTRKIFGVPYDLECPLVYYDLPDKLF